MTPAEIFEQWAIDNGQCSLVAYGSGASDLDYMLFSKEKFDPLKVWGECRSLQSGNRGILVIVGDTIFDISFNRPVFEEKHMEAFINRADMLRNSPVAPRWVCDVHGLKEKIETHIATTERKRMTDSEILSMLNGYYVNLRLIQRKVLSGPLHARFLLIHAIEPTIFQLARQYDLRRGGKGKWKARDAEKVFDEYQLSMMMLRGDLDSFTLAKELYGSVLMVKYWLGELHIEVPDYLQSFAW